jgi:hypothetical protein
MTALIWFVLGVLASPFKSTDCHLVPFGPLKEHPLGFFLGAFSEIDLDLFNQGSDYRRRYFEG